MGAGDAGRPVGALHAGARFAVGAVDGRCIVADPGDRGSAGGGEVGEDGVPGLDVDAGVRWISARALGVRPQFARRTPARCSTRSVASRVGR